MKYLLTIILAFISQNSLTYAGGYSNFAVPTEIEMVNGGLLIFGAYGNPGGCDKVDMIFIKDTNSHFEGILAMATTALAAQMKLKLYVGTCEVAVTFHYSSTVNINLQGNPVYLKK